MLALIEKLRCPVAANLRFVVANQRIAGTGLSG
jgi:hypothetical protein